MNAVAEPQAAQQPKTQARTIKELLSNVSASRLSAFHQCRLKFMFRYVLGLVKPKSGAMHTGSIVHQALKYWNRMRWKNEEVTLKQLHDIYSEAWAFEQEKSPVNWEDGEQEVDKTSGWRLLETYFRETPIQQDEKPEAVEVSVEADMFHHGLPNLVGIIDLVRAGGLIVDFKTSGKTPDPEMAAHTNDIQLSSYGVLYRESTGKMESGLELHHLIKTKSPKVIITPLPPINDVQENRLFHLMESYVNGLEKKDFVPSPGFQCAGCEFFNECRAWC
jgi:putative RecB family exonuclease